MEFFRLTRYFHKKKSLGIFNSRYYEIKLAQYAKAVFQLKLFKSDPAYLYPLPIPPYCLFCQYPSPPPPLPILLVYSSPTSPHSHKETCTNNNQCKDILNFRQQATWNK